MNLLSMRKTVISLLAASLLSLNVASMAQLGDKPEEPRIALQQEKALDTHLIESRLSTPAVITMAAANASAAYIIHQNYIHQKWWEYRGKWHVDLANAKDGNWFDKVGHFTAWYLVADGVRQTYSIAGMDDKDATLAGLVSAAGFHLITEGHEGFGPHFGFDPVDYAAGMLGAGLMYMQGQSDFFRGISPKISYMPDKSHWENPIFKNSKTSEYKWMKDYEAQKYWLSFNIKDGWSVALGANLDNFLLNQGKWQVYLSPDYDLKQIDTGSEFANTVLNYLNLIKLPTPSIRIYPKFGFYLTAYSKFPLIE
jgi:hypothetical protein